MRRKSRIKFSPKLQSSSLDDIKRFVPKDALNTPVISSYNNLPTSYKNGGETDPPKRDIPYQNLNKFLQAQIATDDSTQNYLDSNKAFEKELKNSNTDFYDPSVGDKLTSYDKALETITSRNHPLASSLPRQSSADTTNTVDPIGQLVVTNTATGGGESLFDMYKKPTTTPVYIPPILKPIKHSYNSIPVKRPGQLQTRLLQENRLTPTVIDPIKSPYVDVQSNTAAGMPMIDTKARREGRVGNTHVPKGYINRGDNKGRVEILQNGGSLPTYKNGGSEKEWQGDREAVNLMHTDGKKYSYNQLRELGYPDSTIVRNWNLDITPEPKSRTTMAESVMGFEQRPVEKTMTRGEAFRQARAAGEKEFTYEGKRYTTELASDKTQTIMQSVPTPVYAIPSTYNPSSVATPVTPKPYVSPYSAPYANMSREQLEEHIKKSWTKSKPYGASVFGARQSASFLKPKEERKMGFVSPTTAQHAERFPNPNKQPSVGEGFLFDKERYVLEKSGQNPRAVTHLDDVSSGYSAPAIKAQEAKKIFSYPGAMDHMKDEQIRRAAGQLDSIYSVSPTFNPMSVYDQTIRSLSRINLFGPGYNRGSNVQPDTITTPRPTRPTESTTIEFRDGGLHRYQQ